MLEVIRERTQGWVAKLILIGITIPFALFGIDSYFTNAGSNAVIAKVGGEEISVQEYSNAMQNLRNRIQAENEKPDLTSLDTIEVKRSVLDNVINEKLLTLEAKDSKFMVGDDQLTAYITNLDEFKQDGKFSQEMYDQILSQNKLTSSRFEAMMRKDLTIQQAKNGVAALTYMPKQKAESVLALEYQAREVSVADIKSKDFLSQVTVKPEEVKAYYEKNKDKFRSPERVKVEFVLLAANMLIKDMTVSPDEVKQYYQENAQQFQGDEQRRASHILISFGVSATPQAKEEAKKKAESVLAEVNKDPAKFAELAKKYSQDPGSGANGGDLGAFGRGAMVKPFEDAVFAMKPGEISKLVESEFGYHIIKLTEITGSAESFDSVKPKILAELLYQKALAKYASEAENFNNMVYEQSTSLAPAAKAFNSAVQKTEWMSREETAKFFKSEKMMQAIFSDEVLKEKRNSEAIETAPNSLISARVIDYQAATPRKFEEVSSGIEEALRLEAATKLAVQKGNADLQSLKAGKAIELEWTTPAKVTRKDAQGLTDITMNHVFNMDTKTLPAYLGVEDKLKGFHLIKVSAVEDSFAKAQQSDKEVAQAELQKALQAEYLAAYIKSLRIKNSVTIKEELLNASNAK